ncbi:MAG: phage capsid protein [Archaeoglobaceae archaeon]
MSSENIVVQVDIESILKKIDEKFEALMSEIKPKTESGKGEVIAPQEDRRKRIVESLKRGVSLREQWETPLVLPTKPMASLMDYVQKSRELEARRAPVGSTIYIPVIKDSEADILASPGAALTPKTGLYDIVSATVKEAAITTEIGYHLIEQLSEDLLAGIENVFQKAIVRAIDKAILDEIASKNTASIDKSTETVNFKAVYIAEALGEVASQGKSLTPQDFVLVVNPRQYVDLYKDIAASQALVFARPDVVRDGVVTEFMGVKILVSSYLPSAGTGKVSAYLIHKNSVVLATQREIMVETERNTQARMIKLTGTSTFATAVVDEKAICKIITPA